MKTAETVLNIYCLTQPILNTEWASIQGDKYRHALPFSWNIVDDIESAQVVAWDGVITPKNRIFISKVMDQIKSGKILLLQGEASTLMRSHPFVELVKPDNLNIVEVHGWGVLPEELLSALELCHKKLGHV